MAKAMNICPNCFGSRILLGELGMQIIIKGKFCPYQE